MTALYLVDGTRERALESGDNGQALQLAFVEVDDRSLSVEMQREIGAEGMRRARLIRRTYRHYLPGVSAEGQATPTSTWDPDGEDWAYIVRNAGYCEANEKEEWFGECLCLVVARKSAT